MVAFDGTCQTDMSGSFTNLDTIMLNSLKTKEPCIHTKVEAASAQTKTLCVCVYNDVFEIDHLDLKLVVLLLN